MDPQLKWLLQMVVAIASLWGLIETGRKHGWISI